MTSIRHSQLQDLIPRLDTIRRVPDRYHRIFPLELMKHYQFLVVGAAPGTLTVAITGQGQGPLLESLQRLSGRSIFPVYVHPARMSLLIERIERCERRKSQQLLLGRPCYLHRIQLQSMIQFLTQRQTFKQARVMS